MPVQENYSDQQANENIPAYVQEAPEDAGPRDLKDVVKEQAGDRFTVTMPDESKETMPDRTQAVRDLGGNMENLASAGSEAVNAKNKAEETERDINASRPPEYGDHPPKQTSNDLANSQGATASAEGLSSEQEASPEVGNDNDYNYGISM
jgi:hypothetical protein